MVGLIDVELATEKDLQISECAADRIDARRVKLNVDLISGTNAALDA